MIVNSADRTTPALLTTKPTWLISQVAAHAHAVVAGRLGEAGARGYHIRVLAALAEFGPASQVGLGRHAEMDRSDVTVTIGELASAGLVRRVTDAGDRRRNVITITDEGLARLRELDGILSAAQEEVLAALSDCERSVLAGLLERLLERASGAARDTRRREETQGTRQQRARE